MKVRLLLLSLILLTSTLQSAYGAALFGRPKTLQNDGSYDSGFSDTSYTGASGVPSTFIAPQGGTCKVSCNNSQGAIQIDVRKRCMCISGSKCFTIDVGKGYPGSETTNGIGTMGRAPGTSYHTLPGPGTTDCPTKELNRNGKTYYVRTGECRDAVSMGIAANSKHGKWIHKSTGCGAGGNPRVGGRNNTAGCIAVPCAYWPEVKGIALAGKSVQVCNGSPYETSADKCKGRCKSSSGERGSAREGAH